MNQRIIKVWARHNIVTKPQESWTEAFITGAVVLAIIALIFIFVIIK